MDKELRTELEEWVKDNYNPVACGYTEERSAGNDHDIFYDGYNCGTSDAAYEIGCILGMDLEEPEEQEYEEDDMSIGFNWFKTYKITVHKGTSMFDYDESKLEYIGGGSTSHSCGNISKVQDLIEEYSGKRIPTICGDWIESEEYKLPLIEPSEMSKICEKILSETKVDTVYMRNRIEWFKELSDQGFYLSYDYE